jgi:hypothetical protein
MSAITRTVNGETRQWDEASKSWVKAPEDPGMGESAARGAAQGATLGFADELVGAAKAVAGAPRRLIEAAKAGPFGAPAGVVDDYRAERDIEREKNRAAEEANPKSYLAGQVGGGVVGGVAAAALPGGAASTLGRAVASGAGYGAAAGLGNSEADLTRGDVKGAVVDTIAGAGAGAGGGAAGYGVAKIAEATRRAFSAALNDSKMVQSLGTYLKNITEKGGPPAARRAAAGRLMNEARKAAGDTPLEVDNFAQLAAKLREEAANPLAGGLSSEAKSIIDNVDAIAKRGAADGGGASGVPRVTLTEMDNALQSWSANVQAWKNDPAKQRIAKMARDALSKDLDAAAGNTSLGEAARTLYGARTQYASAKRAEDLQGLLLKSEDAKSVDKLISPGKFAILNSGANRAKVERLLADDPEALEAWRMGVDAAKLMAKKGASWLPADLKSPKVSEAVNRLMTYRNVSKIFGSPERAKEFAKLMSPEIGKNTKEALAIVGRLSASLADAPKRVRATVYAEDDQNMPPDVAAAVGMK